MFLLKIVYRKLFLKKNFIKPINPEVYTRMDTHVHAHLQVCARGKKHKQQ